MIRRIIEIDQDKCNGCGLCVSACHEAAIGLVDGKAQLMRDDYCDGLGDCLPACPTGAISFVEREAADYDEAEVKRRMAAKAQQQEPLPCGCPGTHARAIERGHSPAAPKERPVPKAESQLRQWPVQIKLVPARAPYFDGARLLIAADCTAYAYANFHSEFMCGKITLIGCPKLDSVDYSEKLAQILANNDIKDVTVLRMEVPCCGGLVHAVTDALKASGKLIPWQIRIISTDGTLMDE